MPIESLPDVDDALRKPRSPWVSGAIDALLLLTLLGLANGLIARDDPGFFSINPTPWILLPLVLGTRLGLVAGQIGALLAAAAVFVGFHLWIGESDPATLVTEHSYFFVSLLIAGAIGGLVHALLAGPGKAARLSAQHLQQSNTRLHNELNLSRESEDELSRRLLLHGAEFVSIQDRVRQLFSPATSIEREVVESGLLEILRDLFEVSSAAVYRRSDDGRANTWQCTARLGSTYESADSMSFNADQHPVAAGAIAHRDIATCASIWREQAPTGTPPADDNDSAGRRETPLAAIPWSPVRTATPDHLLLIERQPFALATWENLGRIRALFDWVMSVADLNGEASPAEDEAASSGPLLDPGDFSRQIDLALDCAARLRLAFRLVIFEPTEDASAASQQSFVQSFLADQRPGDSLGGVLIGGDSDAFAIGLLMPAASDTAADNRITHILRDVPEGEASVRHRTLVIDGDPDHFNQQWNQLIQPAGTAP